MPTTCSVRPNALADRQLHSPVPTTQRPVCTCAYSVLSLPCPAGNGPNYAMQVAAATNLTLVNYAIGGATSGCVHAAIVSTPPAEHAMQATLTAKLSAT